ncbi:MAG: acetyl-CoA carboxylase biotin carboxyl carrier protein subunit [Flavobacteriales bacterium]|jgi:biotin carboxyl carrier protein|tara:strand:+ start:211 stop:711 length:501 start_codon:yes stop_codon:yes gene_type:complete
MIKVLGKESEYKIEFSDSKIKLNGQAFDFDLIENNNGSSHVLHNSKGYNIEVLKADFTTKEFTIKVNNNIYNLQAKDKYDLLLEQLGMEAFSEEVVDDLKAPMPGLVLGIKVVSGQEVKKGNLLLVLEAMKMENNIKSPVDGVIKSIEIEKGEAVEKNQILIVFEK